LWPFPEAESKLEVTDDADEELNSPKPMPLDSNITEEQREEIQQQLDSFSKERTNFERQVLKWDDKSNDIVVLAKEMCVVIMNMADFMKGQGPFSSSADIIKAAKLVSMIGSNLERLVHELAEQCPESKSKEELLGYLKQIPLFCNQLNLCSKVKEYTFDVRLFNRGLLYRVIFF
jgi:catenin alpha